MQLSFKKEGFDCFAAVWQYSKCFFTSFHKRSANKKNNLVQVFFLLMTLFANEVSKLKVELFSNLMPFMRQ